MWFSRPRLPDDVASLLAIAPDERLLAAGALADGGWAAATSARIVHVLAARATGSAEPERRADEEDHAGEAGGASSSRGVQSRPWHDVDRAKFDPATGLLRITWVDQAPAWRLHPVDPRKSKIPQAVRDRVEASVVHAEELSLPGNRTARVAVRRDADGAMFSQVLAGTGVDLDDPQIVHLIDAAEDRARAAAGLPN